jgi:hypothetical protein
MRVFAACAGAWLALWLSTWVSLPHSWLVALSCALSIAIVYVAAAASGARGWPLFRLLAFLYGGIAVINIQLEALAFKVESPGAVIRSTALGLLEVVGVSALIAFALTREHHKDVAIAGRLPRHLWLRIPAVALSYVVLYLTAGALIFPFVRHFYMSTGTVTVPSMGLVVGTQVVRGLIYDVALLPFFRQMNGRRAHAAFIAGLSLSVLGGISPLLLPVDDVLPPDVRAVHMLEILGSNFTLGVIGGWLLVRRAPSGSARERLFSTGQGGGWRRFSVTRRPDLAQSRQGTLR